MEAAAQVIKLARKLGVLRPRDLARHGLPRTLLQRLVADDRLRKVGRGLYVVADAEPSLHHSLAVIARRVPGAVVCLLSALRVHRVTTQNPFESWVAIATGSRAPRIDGLPLRVVRMAPEPLAAGVIRCDIDGIEVPVFDLEKTVVDCFRFRNTIGLDVALEAIREYFRRPRRRVDRLLYYAEVDRVTESIRPYLEALV